MSEEQAVRIALTAFFIALIPFIGQLICRFLGDDPIAQRDPMYALGKTFGRFVSLLRGKPKQARRG